MISITSTTDRSVLILQVDFRSRTDRAQRYAAAIEALTVAADSAETTAVVLGTGDWFACSDPQSDGDDNDEDMHSLHGWIEELATFPKPLVAAVEGVVSGDQLATALACDQIVAGRTAEFRVLDKATGHPARGGVIFHLSRSIPRSAVLGLLFADATSPAERWYHWGLVGSLVDEGTALVKASDRARLMACARPQAIARAKLLIDAAKVALLHDHLALELGAATR